MTIKNPGEYWVPTEDGYRFRRPLVVNEKDSSILVEIPAGEFEMWDGLYSDFPKHWVYLDRYYIGVFAVTNWQYKRFVDETDHRPPDKAMYGGGTPIWKGRSYPEAYGDHPVVCVSWEDAQSYCRWAGVSLPTEAQWEKAARGPGNFKYPWGGGWNGDLGRFFGNRGSETTVPVNDYPKGVSGYGLYNTSGNVYEWCRDWYGSSYYGSSPKENPEGPSEGLSRVIRGGSWNTDDRGRWRSAHRYWELPSFRRDDLGFRVVLAQGQKGKSS